MVTPMGFEQFNQLQVKIAQNNLFYDLTNGRDFPEHFVKAKQEQVLSGHQKIMAFVNRGIETPLRRV